MGRDDAHSGLWMFNSFALDTLASSTIFHTATVKFFYF